MFLKKIFCGYSYRNYLCSVKTKDSRTNETISFCFVIIIYSNILKAKLKISPDNYKI